jgi:hypothetical protein
LVIITKLWKSLVGFELFILRFQKHLGISTKDFRLHSFNEMVEKGWMEEDFCDFPEENEKKFMMYE